MANSYTFKIKKGKFELEVTSDNKYFVMAQYDKIYQEFTGKPQKDKKTEPKVETKPDIKPEPVKEPEPVEESAEETLEEIIEETPEEPEEEFAEEQPAMPAKDLDEFLYKKNFERDKKEEPKEKELTPEFKDIIKEKVKEVQETEAQKEEAEKTEEPSKKSSVYDILEEKLADIPEKDKERLNLKREEIRQASKALKFKTLDDLITLKKPQTKLDHLLITSYFLQEKEEIEKYSLKQINSIVVPHLKEPIDHSVIHEAVGHEYFEVVPDYLSSEGITEYKITDEGIDYILNEL